MTGRFPMWFHRDTFANARRCIQHRQNVSVLEALMPQAIRRGWGEFAILGTYAHYFEPLRYVTRLMDLAHPLPTANPGLHWKWTNYGRRGNNLFRAIDFLHPAHCFSFAASVDSCRNVSTRVKLALSRTLRSDAGAAAIAYSRTLYPGTAIRTAQHALQLIIERRGLLCQECSTLCGPSLVEDIWNRYTIQ